MTDTKFKKKFSLIFRLSEGSCLKTGGKGKGDKDKTPPPTPLRWPATENTSAPKSVITHLTQRIAPEISLAMSNGRFAIGCATAVLWGDYSDNR